MFHTKVMTTRFLLIAIALFAGFSARAERPDAPNAVQWIGDLGPAAFNDAGGVFLPLSVLEGMRDGSLAPIQQFALVQHTVNSCTKEALSKTPDIRAPYVVAAATFKWGVCLMSSCLKNILLLQLIPLLSNRYGTDSDRQSAKTQGAVLAQAFSQQEGCDGAGNSGIDPALAQMFQ